jgi:hypothetical protein
MKTLITAICSLLLCTQAMGNNAVILGPDLEPVSVRLEAITPNAIKVIDAQVGERLLKPDEVLRLTFTRADASTPDPKRSVLTLRDGQVLVGKLVPSNDEEAVRLKIDADRVVQVSLDEMLSLAVQADSAVPAIQEDDALLLVTGEVLLGFVETFTQDAIGFVIGDADDAIQIPLERITALRIANKPEPTKVDPGTLRVTTADGSVLLIKDATTTNDESGGFLVGESTLPILSSRRADEGVSTEASTRLTMPMNRILTIEPVSTKAVLTSLAGVSWELAAGGEVFGVSMPPRVSSQGEIHLHAPVTVGFDLPDGASRLAFTVAMDLDESIPVSRRKMAGCELVVYAGDEVIARHALTHDGGTKRLNLALNSNDLRMVIEPGVNGPVLDRVVITQAELLVSD